MGAFELRGLGSTAVASRPHVGKLKSQAETREPPKQVDVREGLTEHAASGMVRGGMQRVSVAPEPEMEHMGGGSQGPLRKDPQPPEPRNEHRVTRGGARGRAGITAGGQAAITFQYPVWGLQRKAPHKPPTSTGSALCTCHIHRALQDIWSCPKCPRRHTVTPRGPDTHTDISDRTNHQGPLLLDQVS